MMHMAQSMGISHRYGQALIQSGQALDSEMSLGHFYIRLAITVKTLDSAMSLGSYFVNICFQDNLNFVKPIRRILHKVGGH